jgi:hypothetical protein
MRTILCGLLLAAIVAAPTARGPVTPAELDSLLAPIALYPDQLLAQMLICASKPGTVGTLAEWLRSHQQLEGTALQDAASAAGFEPSYVALVIFPDVVNAMVTQMDRTTRIGQAFAADRSAVFESIQRLRSKARAAGTLKTTPQQEVETRTTSSGQQVIVIEPANPQVVYVPQYNPQVVYVQEDSHADAAAAGIIGFTAGIAIGAAIDNDYYYGPYGMRGGAYMYNDAWDDYYDAREDAREDWTDHREDMAENRQDYARDTQEQRTERQGNRQDTRTNAQSERTERRSNAQTSAQSATQSTTGRTTPSTSGATQESRGYNSGAAAERSGTRSDAFSGYSSGKSERAASQRGQSSRSSSRSGGSRRR